MEIKTNCNHYDRIKINSTWYSMRVSAQWIEAYKVTPEYVTDSQRSQCRANYHYKQHSNHLTESSLIYVTIIFKNTNKNYPRRANCFRSIGMERRDIYACQRHSGNQVIAAVGRTAIANATIETYCHCSLLYTNVIVIHNTMNSIASMFD